MCGEHRIRLLDDFIFYDTAEATSLGLSCCSTVSIAALLPLQSQWSLAEGHLSVVDGQRAVEGRGFNHQTDLLPRHVDMENDTKRQRVRTHHHSDVLGQVPGASLEEI